MKHLTIVFLLICATAVAGFAQTGPKALTTHLKVGDLAPDFTLTDTAGKTVKLSDFRGKKSGSSRILRTRFHWRLSEGASGVSG